MPYTICRPRDCVRNSFLNLRVCSGQFGASSCLADRGHCIALILLLISGNDARRFAEITVKQSRKSRASVFGRFAAFSSRCKLQCHSMLCENRCFERSKMNDGTRSSVTQTHAHNAKPVTSQIPSDSAPQAFGRIHWNSCSAPGQMGSESMQPSYDVGRCPRE